MKNNVAFRSLNITDRYHNRPDRSEREPFARPFAIYHKIENWTLLWSIGDRCRRFFFEFSTSGNYFVPLAGANTDTHTHKWLVRVIFGARGLRFVTLGA